MNLTKRVPTVLLTMGLMGFSTQAWAHVKWFSKFSFSDRPRTMLEAMDPMFWGLLILSVVTIALLAFVDYKYSNARWARRISDDLESCRGYSNVIMRAGAAAVLLLSFQAGMLFEPDLPCSGAIGWIEFALTILLLFNRTVLLAGAGIICLYLYGVASFGWFHMLDYAIFAGVGYYLVVNALGNERIKATGLVMLYVTVGFSLAWVAIEKLLYPQWGLYVLQQHPQLALGLDLRFFLTAAAFIEISLGYLIMICLLSRSLALTITLVFFLTTVVFGKAEVIGHTLIHASLIVFLIEGPGNVYKTPVAWHKNLPLRIAFVCVNFVLLVFILLGVYQQFAMHKYQVTLEQFHHLE